MRSGVELSFDGVTKSYGRHRALDGLTFTAAPGRVTGFLGPNGAGKTTSLRILVGLVRADHGSALIGGVPYESLARPAATVGVSLEGAGFHPRRSGRASLALQARATGVSTARVDEVLAQVGLADAARRPVGGYSLGMRQRLAVAHTVLARPDVLVLDEPSNGLDPDGVRWIRDVLRAEADEGAVVLVSSHMLAEMENVADDIVIVDHGKVLLRETLSALRERSRPAVVVTSSAPERLVAALNAAGIDAYQDVDGVQARGVSAIQVMRVAEHGSIPITDVHSQEASLEAMYFDVLAAAAVASVAVADSKES